MSGDKGAGQGGGCENHALLRNQKQDKSVPAEPKGRILMSGSGKSV